ncbi:hypothetical protein [Parasitella parasitica]|uniref:Zn(2)-C6 fungal-type domain-containing protein n=1 Tax=Parasitella parasitica TaxID=35722 RepID=A0A0B7NIA1_9FUNG|nr:hypothetical protein [Parasitella parasitica]
MPQDISQRNPSPQLHQTANSSTTATIEPRKKRAKIMSACGECRRKKTKCDGEQPCRNCQKSNTACMYPTASQMDDKRNHGGPSKAALEAIEDRLKAIEDMLKTILQSQFPVHDLDPVAVSNFLTKSNGTNNNKNNDGDNSKNNNRLPSIHNLSATLPADTTTTASYHSHNPPTSSSPSSSHHHHSMVSPSTPNVNHLPPPIGLMQTEGYHHHQQQHLYLSQQLQQQEQQNLSQPMKKRKR